MHLVTKLHLEEQTTGQERRGNLYALPAKSSQSCLKCAIKQPPCNVCGQRMGEGCKPYLSCDTIQRQLHNPHVCVCGAHGLCMAWLSMHTSLEYDSILVGVFFWDGLLGDTIQRLHMDVCGARGLLYGLAWHAYRVASLEYDRQNHRNPSITVP